MEHIEDPVLIEKIGNTGVPTIEQSDILENGCKIVGLSKEVLNILGEKLNSIYEKDGCTRNGVAFLQGAIFAIGSKEKGNLEWREHSAASLRETLHEWKDAGNISNAFNLAFPGRVPTMKTDPNIYKRLQDYYGYFSNICHHNVSRETHSLRQIYSSKTKGSHNLEQIFFEIVSKFIEELSNVLSG